MLSRHVLEPRSPSPSQNILCFFIPTQKRRCRRVQWVQWSSDFLGAQKCVQQWFNYPKILNSHPNCHILGFYTHIIPNVGWLDKRLVKLWWLAGHICLGGLLWPFDFHHWDILGGQRPKMTRCAAPGRCLQLPGHPARIRSGTRLWVSSNMAIGGKLVIKTYIETHRVLGYPGTLFSHTQKCTILACQPYSTQSLCLIFDIMTHGGSSWGFENDQGPMERSPLSERGGSAKHLP